jgi:hypothetical protein
VRIVPKRMGAGACCIRETLDGGASVVIGLEAHLLPAPLGAHGRADALEIDGQLMARGRAAWRMEVALAAAPALVVRLGAAGFAERARRKLLITEAAALADLDVRP